MKKTTIFMTIFMTFLTGTLLYIGLSIKKQNKDYTAYENDLIEAAKTYISLEKIGVSANSSYELSIDQMMNDGMIHTNKVNDDECSGHVTIKRVLNNYDYKAYIKCSKYESIKD